MPRVKINAKKMSDADVTHISLVHRGANRIPFKIIKQEKSPMAGKSYAGLDLGALLSVTKADEKPEDAQAEVLGIAAMKSDPGFELIQKSIVDAGYSVDNIVEMDDGSVVFNQTDGDIPPEVEVVRLNDSMALVTKGFNTYAPDMLVAGASFGEVCKAQGFYPGMRSVTDTMLDSVTSVIRDASTPAEAAEKVTKVMSEVSEYVGSMVKQLPSQAFYLEGKYGEVVAARKADSGGEEAEDDSDETEDQGETAAVGAEQAAKADETGDETGDDEKANPLTAESISELVSGQMKGLADSLKATLTEAVDGVKTAVTAEVAVVKTEVAELATKVEKTAETASAAASAVRGTVVTGAEGDDVVPITKGDASKGGPSGIIDTAYMPNRSKRISR